MILAALLQAIQTNPNPKPTFGNVFLNPAVIAAVIALAGVLGTLFWNSSSIQKLTRITLDANEKLEGFKSELAKQERRDEILLTIREKGVTECHTKVEALRIAGYNLFTGLNSLADKNSKLSDEEVLTKIDKILEHFAAFKAAVIDLAPYASPSETKQLKVMERFAVEVILDVARHQSVRQGKEDEMKSHATHAEEQLQRLNAMLINFIPAYLRDWADEVKSKERVTVEVVAVKETVEVTARAKA